MSVIFQSYEHQIEKKQVEYEAGENIQEVFYKMVETYEVADELGFFIDINDVIIVMKNNKTRRIHPDEEIETLIQQSQQNSLELILVCPHEEGAVLIQYIIDKKYCYFENYVNKNDQLENFISNLCKKINYQKKYQIKMNGHKNNPKSPFEKKTIKQLMASSNSQKILIEIDETVKSKDGFQQSKPQSKKIEIVKVKEQKPISKKVEPQSKKQSPVKKQQSFKDEKQVVPKVPNQPKQQINNINQQQISIAMPNAKSKEVAFINQKQQKVEQPKINHVSQKSDSPVESIVNAQGYPGEVQNEKLLFSVHFETNFGLRSISYEVEKTKTMKNILPKVLQMLVQAGFDWDINWKDQSDYRYKLAIFYGKHQYRKLDSKFMSLLPNTPKKVHEFDFQRMFEGG